MELLDNFKSGMEQRERIVRNRDLKETIGAVVGIVGFGYLAFGTPFVLAKIGCVLVIISYFHLIYKLRNNRKSKHMQQLFLPMEEQLQQQKTFMLNQAKLLNTVFFWMVLPLFVSNMIFVWGIGNPEGHDIPSIILETIPIKLSSKLIWTIGMTGLMVYVVWTNKKAAKVNWLPLIKQLDNILTQMKK